GGAGRAVAAQRRRARRRARVPREAQAALDGPLTSLGSEDSASQARIGLRPIGLLSCSKSVDFARLRRLRLAARIGLRPIGLLSCRKSVDFARLRRLRLAARGACGAACGTIQTIALPRKRRGYFPKTSSIASRLSRTRSGGAPTVAA